MHQEEGAEGNTGPGVGSHGIVSIMSNTNPGQQTVNLSRSS